MTAPLALLAIDFQRAFADAPEHWGGERSEPGAEDRARALLDAFRARGLPIVHVVHDSPDPSSPLRLDAPGGAALPGFAPRDGEPLVVKRENGAFAGTGLDTLLRRAGVHRLVVAGLTVPHCVSTSVRMAANAGFEVTLAGDACAAFAATGHDGRRRDARTVHDVELAVLHGEFCTVRTGDDVIAALATPSPDVGASETTSTPSLGPSGTDPASVFATDRDFETESAVMTALFTVTVLCPIGDVPRIMDAVHGVAPLVQGPYDSNAFVCAPGIERYRPLGGAAAGAEPDVRELPGTVLVDFELPRDPRVLERVVQTVFEAHSYQEPVIKVREGWVSRSKGLDDGDNANRWWNTTGDWKKLDGLPGPKGA